MANHDGSLRGMRKYGTGWSMVRIRQWGSSTQSPGTPTTHVFALWTSTAPGTMDGAG